MQFIATLLTRLAYIDSPSLAGWLVWVGLAGLLVFLLSSWRKYHSRILQRNMLVLIALALLTPITTLFLGLEFSSSGALPVPGLPAQAPGSTVMVFSAIPWTLAGGLFGPFVGAGLGVLS